MTVQIQTAGSTNNVLYAMHKYPMTQFKLSEVLDGLNKDKNGKFEYDDLMQSEYLDAFVKETMRLTPGLRALHKMPLEDTAINGIEIDKNQQININILLQSRHRDVFEDPDEFDPYRWMNGNSPSKYAFTPFGIGSKMCLGWRLAYVEMELMVALFQSKVRMEIDEERLEKAKNPFNFWDIYGRFHPLERN